LGVRAEGYQMRRRGHGRARRNRDPSRAGVRRKGHRMRYDCRGGEPTMTGPRIDFSREEFAALCRRHGIRRVAFFGSVLRDDFTPESDIDMLVEFEPEAQPGWEIVDIQREFSLFFDGRSVDFVNPKYLNRRLKDRVLASAEVVYAA
jgi:predicted nucleotidyltransferase